MSCVTSSTSLFRWLAVLFLLVAVMGDRSVAEAKQFELPEEQKIQSLPSATAKNLTLKEEKIEPLPSTPAYTFDLEEEEEIQPRRWNIPSTNTPEYRQNVPFEHMIYADNDQGYKLLSQLVNIQQLTVIEDFKIGSMQGKIVRGNVGRISTWLNTNRMLQEANITIAKNSLFRATKVVAQPNAPWFLARLTAKQVPLRRTLYCYKEEAAGQDVNVYVLDSGINTKHPEFEGKQIIGKSFVPEDDSLDDHISHGTGVASLIGGHNYGAAKKSRLINVKILDHEGFADCKMIIRAIQYVQQSIRTDRSTKNIINLSIAGEKNKAINDAVLAIMRMGVYVVTGSGNDYGKDACEYSPASAPGVLTAGSVNHEDKAAAFTNVGRCVSLYAPGTAIRHASNNIKDKGFEVGVGTSLSAGLASGVLALVLSDPALRFSSVQEGMNHVMSIAAAPANGPRLLHSGIECQ